MSSERERILELEQLVKVIEQKHWEAQQGARLATAVALGVKVDWLDQKHTGMNVLELLDAAIERFLRKHPEHAEVLKRPEPPEPLAPFYGEQGGQTGDAERRTLDSDAQPEGKGSMWTN